MKYIRVRVNEELHKSMKAVAEKICLGFFKIIRIIKEFLVIMSNRKVKSHKNVTGLFIIIYSIL